VQKDSEEVLSPLKPQIHVAGEEPHEPTDKKAVGADPQIHVACEVSQEPTEAVSAENQIHVAGEVAKEPTEMKAAVKDEVLSQESELEKAAEEQLPSPTIPLLKKKRNPTHCSQKYESGDLAVYKGGQDLTLHWPFEYAIKVHKLVNTYYLPSIRRQVDGSVECSGWPYVEHVDQLDRIGVVFNTMVPTKDERVPFIPPLPYQIADRIVWTLFVPKSAPSR